MSEGEFLDVKQRIDPVPLARQLFSPPTRTPHRPRPCLSRFSDLDRALQGASTGGSYAADADVCYRNDVAQMMIQILVSTAGSRGYGRRVHSIHGPFRA